jgi:predicted ABC-type transport system involved in lysophospholipase L1 biosynthesis ATPase subunit
VSASEAGSGVPDVALGYEPPNGRGGRVWIPLGGSHRAAALSESQRKRLVGAVLEVRAEPQARLVLLGVEVEGLRATGRAALRERVAFLPPDGGLLSNLNAWENIVLPTGFHRPRRMRGIEAQVNELLRSFGADPRELLDKLPEKMTPYERKLTGYVRIWLEKPDLMLVEDLQGGLEAAERAAAARFSAAYLESCPGGTFVQLDIAAGP